MTTAHGTERGRRNIVNATPAPNPTREPAAPGTTLRRSGLHGLPPFTLVAGAFYMFTAGIHVGIVMTDSQKYDGVADGAWLGFVRSGWSDVFMANPGFWGLMVAAGEATLGVLLLVGGRVARIGWAGIIAFQCLLVLLSWNYLLWSVPATLVLLAAARHDWPLLRRSD